MAINCVSVHRIYIALEPSLDGKEPTAFKAVVLSLKTAKQIGLTIPPNVLVRADRVIK